MAGRRLLTRPRSAARARGTGLVRHGLPPLAACDRATGDPLPRYERARPGELVHVDVKKLGRIPDGGGHKALGRAVGSPNKDCRTGAGWAYLLTALDDHSHLAYTEDLPDETAPTCAAFLRRATAWFASTGVTEERVLTDNAWAYSKNTWRQTCHDLGIQLAARRPGAAPRPVQGPHHDPRALRRRPLDTLTPADLRTLISQDVALPYVLPLAVALLLEDPLLDAHFYEGDLLHAAITRPAAARAPLPGLAVHLALAASGLPATDELSAFIAAHTSP